MQKACVTGPDFGVFRLLGGPKPHKFTGPDIRTIKFFSASTGWKHHHSCYIRLGENSRILMNFITDMKLNVRNNYDHCRPLDLKYCSVQKATKSIEINRVIFCRDTCGRAWLNSKKWQRKEVRSHICIRLSLHMCKSSSSMLYLSALNFEKMMVPHFLMKSWSCADDPVMKRSCNCSQESWHL